MDDGVDELYSYVEVSCIKISYINQWATLCGVLRG